MSLWEGLEISARIPRRKKNSVIEEAKHVGAIFAGRPCAGRGNVGVGAKQNPSLKYMEPAQMKGFEDLLLAYRIVSGQLLADGPLCGGDVAGSGKTRGEGCGGMWMVVGGRKNARTLTLG